MRRALLLLAIPALIGCYPDLSGYRVERGVSGGDAGMTGDCSASVTSGTIRPNLSSCFLDENISGQSGTLYYACSGDGTASLLIGGRTFTGTVEGGEVSLEHLSTYVNMGGGQCRWLTFQHVTGAIEGGTLDYRYNEEPAPEERGCANACSGTGDLEIAR